MSYIKGTATLELAMTALTRRTNLIGDYVIPPRYRGKTKRKINPQVAKQKAQRKARKITRRNTP